VNEANTPREGSEAGAGELPVLLSAAGGCDPPVDESCGEAPVELAFALPPLLLLLLDGVFAAAVELLLTTGFCAAVELLLGFPAAPVDDDEAAGAAPPHVPTGPLAVLPVMTAPESVFVVSIFGLQPHWTANPICFFPTS
jgi:hypothetical protein